MKWLLLYISCEARSQTCHRVGQMHWLQTAAPPFPHQITDLPKAITDLSKAVCRTCVGLELASRSARCRRMSWPKNKRTEYGTLSQ
jgi:hypothetical protein